MTATEAGMDATLNGQPHNGRLSQPSVTDESEIQGLHTAIEKVLAKITWHEERIEGLETEISDRRSNIEELRLSLRKHVGPLMTESLNAHREEARKENESATGKLIADCLKKSNKPLDTKQIKDYLEQQGNETNPSVELSRMVKRGLIERAGRGLYQAKK